MEPVAGTRPAAAVTPTGKHKPMGDDLANVRFIATVDQLAAIIRDSLDRLDAPITDPTVQRAVGFTARLLLEMDPNPNANTLATHAAIQSALEAVR